ILGGSELGAFVSTYGVCREGNLPRRGRASGTGENVLHLARTGGEVAADMGILPSELDGILASAMAKVRSARGMRVRPARDEKVLTDWNGLAIAAFAIAARVFGSDEYLATARAAADFVLSALARKDGRLWHRYRSGDAAVPGNADDHAFLAWGLIELYRASFDTRFLDRAATLTDLLVDHFRDGDRGGLFFTPDDGEPLIARLKPVHDGATPSANSVALQNLLLLSHLTGRTRYLDLARELEAWYLGEHAGSAAASGWMMAALQAGLHPPIDVVVVGEPDAADTRALLAAISSRGRPDAAVLLKPASGDPLLEALAPFTRAFTLKSGKAAAYVCRNHTCELPVTDPEALGAILDSASPKRPVGHERSG
ncbi:MAG TPA: thioredoxin domain-containing protein, partial [Methanomicrobiales archaeon]|nr:thioredoxin domain-containing protein [Methanomicrobiales archaeon]